MKVFSEDSALQLAEKLLQNDKNIKTELEKKIPNINGLASTEYVDNAIQNVDVDLTDYAKKDDIPTDYITVIPEEYVTTTEMQEAITNAQLGGKDVDLTGYATETFVTDKIAEIDIPSLEGYAKTEDIPDISNLVEKENGKGLFSGSYNDLSNKPTIPEAYDDSALVEMIEDVEASLNNKVDKTELHTHSNKNVLDNITNDKITSWDAKATESFVTNAIAQAQLDGSDVDLSGLATKDDLNVKADKTELFSGSYNDLTDKPTIPSIDGLVTETVLNTTLVDYAKTTDIPTSLPASDVPAWAKEENKPTYTASEVGALPDTTVIPSINGLATEDYVNTTVSNISVELSGYYKKEDVDEIISELRIYIEELLKGQQPSEPESDTIVENEVLSITNSDTEVANGVLILGSDIEASYKDETLTL